MAPRRGMKRAASRSAGGALKKSVSGVAPKCRTIASAIRGADLPAPVRSMVCDMLTRTFATYKEERHPLQASVSKLVGEVLDQAQTKLQASIDEAQQKKSAFETEAAPLTQANDEALAASEAAAKSVTDSTAAVAEGKKALKDAKAALHNLEKDAKAAEAEAATSSARKAKLETLISTTLPEIRNGTKKGDAVGKHVASVVGESVEKEFLTCVARTYSTKASEWGTFDNIVDKRTGDSLASAVESLGAEVGEKEKAKEALVAQIEGQKSEITAAEDKIKSLEETLVGAQKTAKEAESAAKEAGSKLNAATKPLQKANEVYKDAEDALAAFKKGALAAYAEIEARTAPPPPPEAAEEAVDEAMTAAMAAPSGGAEPSPFLAASPGVLLTPSTR